MGAFIAKQPNGLFCRFSSIVDCPTHWNMTEEEYIEYCAVRGREEARETLKNHVQPFERVKEEFQPHNMSAKEFRSFLEECEGLRGKVLGRVKKQVTSYIMTHLLRRERMLADYIKAIDNAKDDYELEMEINRAMEYVNSLEIR